MNRVELKQRIMDAELILLDIEGTLVSIDFVRGEIYRHAEQNIAAYIYDHWDELEYTIERLEEQNLLDMAENLDGCVPLPTDLKNGPRLDLYKRVVGGYVKWQIHTERWTPTVKHIHALVTADLFRAREVVSHLYPDVATALEFWSSMGKKICTFSNGGCPAQVALFSNTVEGSMMPFFTSFYDSTFGSKLNPESYKLLLCEFEKVDPRNAVFFTDSPLDLHNNQTETIVDNQVSCD